MTKEPFLHRLPEAAPASLRLPASSARTVALLRHLAGGHGEVHASHLVSA